VVVVCPADIGVGVPDDGIPVVTAARNKKEDE